MDNIDRTSHSPSLLRRLLMEPEYRIARHSLLIAMLIIVALNQAFMTFGAGLEVLGYRIFLQAAFLFVTYVVACYFNLWVLLPRYLLRKEYLRYALRLVIGIFLLVILQTLEERAVLCRIGLLDDFYTFPRIFLTIFSSLALLLLCLSGGAMTILLRQWMMDNQKVSRLEKLHIQSEVEQLKEQVNPQLLFSILNRTGVLAVQQPREASDMLLRLSQLLRYQLYDCNRDKVLLSTEIKFLNNYLTLEQMYSHSLEFHIQSDKDCAHVLVSPLLFISFVQAAVARMYERGKGGIISIGFRTMEDTVTFVCRCAPQEVFLDIDFSKISKRLELLYKNHYSLTVSGREITLTLDT